MDLIDALVTGAKHTYGQIRDDVSSLMQGEINPGTMGRLAEVLTNLPLEGLVAKTAQSPLVAGIMQKGGKYFHGTPKVFKDEMKSADGLAGPGFYLTNNPEVAGSYASGSTFGYGGKKLMGGGEEALQQAMQTQAQAEKSWLQAVKTGRATPEEAQQALSAMEQLGPNIRPYRVKPHETFNMDRFLDRGDLDLMRNAAADPSKVGALPQDSRDALMGLLNSARPDQNGSELMYGLETALGNRNSMNKFLQDAGFQSISYSGGKRLGAGVVPGHDAVNVLDMSIMQPYLDAAAAAQK